MVSKWKRAGVLVLGEKDRIDAASSLSALVGVVDDALHAAALLKLDTFAPKIAATQTSITPLPNSRQEKDHWQAQLAALKYAREAGQVCDVAAVENHASAAFEELRAAITQTIQDAQPNPRLPRAGA